MAIVSVGMAVGGLFLVLNGQTLAGLRALVFFSACALAIGYQVWRRGPHIVFDQNGILDRTLEIGVIPWSEIQGAFGAGSQLNPTR
jgi:hypothetical protein